MSPVHNKDGGTANETMLPRVDACLGQITLCVCHNSHWEGKWEPLGYINDSRPTTDVKKELGQIYKIPQNPLYKCRYTYKQTR